MLDGRQFDIMPILADALQDAGCADEPLLAQCRNPKLEQVQAERLVNLIYSEETAAAVRWLEQFVRGINYHDYKDENDEVGTRATPSRTTTPTSFKPVVRNRGGRHVFRLRRRAGILLGYQQPKGVLP